MLQLITAAVAEGKRAPRYSLLLGNRTEGDILCREQLEDGRWKPDALLSLIHI